MMKKKSAETDQTENLRMAFRIFDKDKSGYIEAREIIWLTTTLGQGLTQDELDIFMKEADLDGDGRLNYEEFCRIMTKMWNMQSIKGLKNIMSSSNFSINTHFKTKHCSTTLWMATASLIMALVQSDRGLIIGWPPLITESRDRESMNGHH